MNIERGKVFLVDLDPTVGAEVSKTRPALVVSNNQNNRFRQTVTVVPISSNVERVASFEAFLPRGAANLSRDSKAKTDHIRTIDRSRLVKEIGRLSEADMKRVEAALKIHLSL